jgi:hypothetical protein
VRCDDHLDDDTDGKARGKPVPAGRRQTGGRGGTLQSRSYTPSRSLGSPGGKSA